MKSCPVPDYILEFDLDKSTNGSHFGDPRIALSPRNLKLIYEKQKEIIAFLRENFEVME